MKITAIITAAGRGERMGFGQNKIFLELKDPVLIHSLRAFEENTMINDIILVVNEEETEECRRLIDKYSIKKINTLLSPIPCI